MIEQQIKLEKQNISEAIDKYRQKVTQKEGNLPPDFFLMKKAFNPFRDSLAVYLKDNARGGHYGIIKKYLKELKPDELTFITLQYLISKDFLNVPLQTLCQKIGKEIQQQINYNRFKAENKAYVKAIVENQKTSTPVHKRRAWGAILKNKAENRLEMTPNELFMTGKKLIEVLIENTGVVQTVKGKSKTGTDNKSLAWTKEVQQFIEQAHKRCEIMFARNLPMIVPPVPWTDNQNGGYYVQDLKLIDTKNPEQRKHIPEVFPEEILEAVNKIQATAWVVNKQVLEIAKSLLYKKNNFGVLTNPRQEREEPQAVIPTGTKEEQKAWIKANPEKFVEWKQKMTQFYDFINAQRTKVRAEIDTINTANDFSKYKKIYFPHFMDFRGRIYPAVTHLNPQAGDLAKGLLLFAQKKQLGKKGIDWLAIHGANCFGEDKIPLKDRIIWTEENTLEILKSAENPLENLFWTQADKPWQFLAFCFEWKAMFELENPEKYKCSLPVNIDGSCNGLQHLAALLKDEQGGFKVNLQNAERQDVYSLVLSKVKEKLTANLIEYSEDWLPVIDRKLIKRNVMTVPYGVTQRGMAEQLAAEIKLETSLKYRRLQENLNKACNALGIVNYETIRTEIPSAIIVKEWLQACSEEFTKHGQPVYWTTPLGLKVVQEKLKTTIKRVETTMGKSKIKLNFKVPTSEIDKRKQAEGISPNLIHSLDATHLMMTVLACPKINSWAMVHDSFGCLPSDMEQLYKATRETFVNLYSKPVLEDIRNQFIEQLPQGNFPELPEMGQLKITEVLDSEYFFA
jgi:DNA-directed RNA polymerase